MIDSYAKEIERLERLANCIDPNTEGGEDAAIKLKESKTLLNAQISVLSVNMDRVMQVIEGVKKSDYKSILASVYIEGRRLTDLPKVYWLSYQGLVSRKHFALLAAYKILEKSSFFAETKPDFL